VRELPFLFNPKSKIQNPKWLSAARWLFGPGPPEPGYLWPRWLFLRALGFIFFTAFYSLLFQIRGLIGPEGILPAGEYLQIVGQRLGVRGFWYAPTLLWLASGDRALLLLCWAGLVAAVLLMLNLWPRAALVVCVTLFLSFVSAARDFSEYQSDGMLLEAGFLSWFFAPPGLRPGLGERHPPSRASLFMLRWECFRIYFESGIVKLASGDPQWRHLTAMDHYYENGPLPNWIGWYVQQLPHGFHAAATVLTLVMELALVWMFFLRRPLRILLFFLITPFQVSIILTANLGFLNHLVLVLGVLLLDDRFLRRLLPRLAPRTSRVEIGNSKLETGKGKLETGNSDARNWKLEVGNSEIESREAQTLASQKVPEASRDPVPITAESSNADRHPVGTESLERGCGLPGQRTAEFEKHELCATPAATVQHSSFSIHRWQPVTRHLSLVPSGLFLTWIFYNTTVLLLLYLFRSLPVSLAPVVALEPFRISNQYGLFAVMTTARYEIEFQGTRDGQNWLAYPFRYKPQDPRQPPRIHAPYQPRFDWNLWFASLGSWRQYPWVVTTEELLLKNDSSVLSLFAGNPFPGEPPRAVRAVKWQYWFTDLRTKREEGLWWRRELRGLYAPTLERDAQGNIGVLGEPVR
jgi:Lipase maturation factor